MNFSQLQKRAEALYYPVFLLENFSSHATRKKTVFWVGSLALFFSFLSLFLYGVHTFPFFQNLSVLLDWNHQIYGVCYLLICLWAFFFLCEAFYYSYYHMSPSKEDVFIDYDLASALYAVQGDDIASGFFSTRLGGYMLLRAGIQAQSCISFFTAKPVHSPVGFVCNPERGIVTLSTFIASLYDHDTQFADFVFTYGIQKKDLVAIAEWISSDTEREKEQEYWWSKDALQKISGIGQEWAYGRAYHLEQYQQYIPSHTGIGGVATQEMEELEAILSRTQEGNALLIGNDTTEMMAVVSELQKRISQDAVLESLKNKKIILFDFEAFISRYATKADFENAMMSVLREAVSAGNIIFVVNNTASFVSSAQTIGVSVLDLYESYFSIPSIKFVFISDTDHFHGFLEKNLVISKYFEKIVFKDVGGSSVIRILQEEIIRYEQRGFFFTYQSLLAIADSVERYFSEGIVSDKVVDLLSEIVPRLELQKKFYVEKKDVLDLVQTKTGIPMGQVSATEKDKLLNLEEILHKRIIGQKEAISAISSAVRRARSGITNPNRPLGSFLFLGPTGVGKTETTKALADVFFGADAQIMRLDMSEYSSVDALTKLIGSFETKQEGVLSSMLREHQYGVLLLDEFEKTTSEVMNLFLQILDEGFFSDMSGKKVMARNTIIIATSNAGSNLIWNFEKQGIDVATQKDTIINDLVTQGIYKPELLNRFDGVIVFHPLTPDDLRKIATLLLEKLHARLAERGVNLVVNNFLVDFVVRFGTDPQFGARPMNRAIQEKVEQVVAEKILKSDGKPGTMIELSDTDFNAGSV